jgi:proline dehydrogenase
MNLSFDNTSVAFAYKSDKELKNARWLFETMGLTWVSAAGVRLTPFLMKTGLPVHGLIRKTIFKQFVGGETLEQTSQVCKTLGDYNVQVILDYGVEGKEGEAEFEHATQEFIRVIEYAASQKNIPFISIKVTGFARFGLLQTLNEAPRLRSGIHDHELENEEWNNVRERMFRICAVAAEKGIGVLVDAEESWIQDPVDRLTMEMMEEFNKEKVIIYNTIQLYRHDRLRFLKMSHQITQKQGVLLGVKLVRGAYMEKERLRAVQNSYDSPIQNDKSYSDGDYNAAVEYCINNLDSIGVIIASHNEYSTFNLAKAGFSVSKYVPFGPIRDVIPYLMRRAQENSSVSGQTGRELGLIKKELNRRIKKGQD